MYSEDDLRAQLGDALHKSLLGDAPVLMSCGPFTSRAYERTRAAAKRDGLSPADAKAEARRAYKVAKEIYDGFEHLGNLD
jgi:hypothetical protein